MHSESDTLDSGNSRNGGNEELKKFMRYLVIDIGENGGYCIKGIRADAPEETIDEFVQWYRENNRYENGRLRPEGIVRKTCVIAV